MCRTTFGLQCVLELLIFSRKSERSIQIWQHIYNSCDKTHIPTRQLTYDRKCALKFVLPFLNILCGKLPFILSNKIEHALWHMLQQDGRPLSALICPVLSQHVYKQKSIYHYIKSLINGESTAAHIHTPSYQLIHSHATYSPTIKQTR